MTVDRNEKPVDDFLATLSILRTCDVSERRARQLRRRCHDLLKEQPSVGRLSGMVPRAPLRRNIVLALAGAWCLTYVVEIIRCTAAVYGYVGVP